MRGVRPWKFMLFRILVSGAEGMLIVLAGGFLLAVLILWLGLPSAGVLRGAAGVVWAVGSFLAGRRCGCHGRRRGAWEGFLCGCFLLLFRFGGAVALHEMPYYVLLPALLLPVSGAAGGICGVNTKIRKAPD